MLGRLLALVAVVASLVGFIFQVTGSHDWWPFALNRAGLVLVVLAIALALMGTRGDDMFASLAQALAILTAFAFLVVALAKYYTGGTPMFAIQTASQWASEASFFGLAALAFALTLARRPSGASMLTLVLAGLLVVGCGVYAFTLQADFAEYIWWSTAQTIAFVAASGAAGLVRGGTLTLSAPVPSSPPGNTWSDPVVEEPLPDLALPEQTEEHPHEN